MSRVTLRERFFPLHQPADVDRFLERLPVVGRLQGRHERQDLRCVAGGAECARAARRTWPSAFIRLPEDRAGERARERRSPASRTAVRSRSCSTNADARFHLDELRHRLRSAGAAACASIFRPTRGQPSAMRRSSRSSRTGRSCRSTSTATCREERFQWAYLERFQDDAIWRDDETFDVLNSLFENQWGRDVRAARLVALGVSGAVGRAARAA